MSYRRIIPCILPIKNDHQTYVKTYNNSKIDIELL